MLVLTQGVGEYVKIGEDIEVKVLKVVGRKVLLGFSVPKEVRILRSKVLERDQHEQAQIQDINSKE